MKKIIVYSLGFFLAAFVGLGQVPEALGYDEVDISNSGSLAGRMILEGPRPEARVFALVNYPFGSFCKKISDGEGYVRLRDFIVQKDGGLWEAVVAFKKISGHREDPVN